MNIKTVSFHTLRILLGAVFVFSGIIKLFPIGPLELTFIDLGIAGWTLAPIFARFIISAEIFLGLSIILNLRMNKLALPGAFIMVLIFTAYLLYSWLIEGNDRNCGCFGDLIPMTPKESLLKNIVMFFLIGAVWKMESQWSIQKNWLNPLLIVVSVATPYVFSPINILQEEFGAIENSESLDFSLLPKFIEKDTVVDYSKGKFILGFLSLRCQHCRVAARKLSIMSRQMEMPPVYFFFIGPAGLVPEFYHDTKTNFPFAMFQSNDFFKFSGSELPGFILINDGIIIKHWNGDGFSPAVIKDMK